MLFSSASNYNEFRLNDNGNYYVGMISPRIPGKPHLLELLGPYYLARRFLVRLVSLKPRYACTACRATARLLRP